MEDCRQPSHPLDADLLRAGEQVVRVPAKMMAGTRRRARTRGMFDLINTLAVARAARAEPGLPPAHLDGPTRQIRLLIDCRRPCPSPQCPPIPAALAPARTGARLEPPARSLDLTRTLSQIKARLAHHHGTVADPPSQLLHYIRHLTHWAPTCTPRSAT